jgi:mannitol/fructose-specific phosphotransferase system IIA component (Ntr-type)
MAKLGLVAPKLVEEVVTLAMKREELGVTAIGRGIAIPHATTQAVAEITSIVGRLPSPIDWDALDGEPVRAVFLSIVPAIYPDTHQKHLAIFAEFAKSL